ncbi:hypothetical protein F5887DRAFT_105995 [Amanita rubescens]|nr:hypothetical protein F5887DRAFT_105995 [Amanita rubescens]
MLSRILLSMMLLATVALVQASSTGLLLEKLNQIQLITPKRQSSSNISLSQFPQQCQSGCATAVNALNTCSSATCLCNTSVDKSLGQCINCSVNADPSLASASSGQQVLDTYNSFCKGTNVSTLSLSVTASLSANATASSTFSFSLGPTTTVTQLGSPTIITSLPTATTVSTSAAKQSNVGYGSIGVIIALLAPLLA